MKKFSLAVILLCLVCLAAVSCGKPKTPDECKHKRMTETQVQSDCSLEGYIQHVCIDCGYTYKSDFSAPSGHKLTSTGTAATCTEEGYTTYTCSVCGYSYKAGYTEPTGHTITSKITEQTCTTEGYTTCSCPCGYSYQTAFVGPNGHTLSKTTVAPVCTADGYDLYTCKNCEYQYKTNFTAMAHTLKATVVAPTCKEMGYTLKSCEACDYEHKTDYVIPTGHTFTQKTVAPTFASEGYTIFTCKCGFTYIGDYVWISNILSGIRGNEDEVFARGVDLSYHNKTVNFEKLAEEGVDFVILRVGYLKENRAEKDEKFEEYYAAAKAAGLDVGAYIFTYVDNAEDLVALTKKLLPHLEGKTFEYPIYLDVEPNAESNIARLSEDVLMEMCYEYCELMVENKYYPGIYSGRNFILYNMNAEQLTARFELWGAHYYSANKEYDVSTHHPSENDYANEYSMWQWSDLGLSDNLGSKHVDLNVCYKDYPTIIKEFGYNGHQKEG